MILVRWVPDALTSCLRRQAFDRMGTDLAGWSRLLDGEPYEARTLILQKLQPRLVDADFAGVRGPEALAGLPEAEREPCRKLWGDVADTPARAARRTSPQKNSLTK